MHLCTHSLLPPSLALIQTLTLHPTGAISLQFGHKLRVAAAAGDLRVLKLASGPSNPRVICSSCALLAGTSGNASMHAHAHMDYLVTNLRLLFVCRISLICWHARSERLLRAPTFGSARVLRGYASSVAEASACSLGLR